MNAPLLSEHLYGRHGDTQGALSLAAEGVERYVWQGRFGPMLIEVIDGVAYVNGQRVEPAMGIETSNGGIA